MQIKKLHPTTGATFYIISYALLLVSKTTLFAWLYSKRDMITMSTWLSNVFKIESHGSSDLITRFILLHPSFIFRKTKI